MANMTPALVRAGRAILKLTASEVAERCRISRGTLVAYETGKSDERVRGLNRASRFALAQFFQDAGIEFVGGENPGLIVHKPELLDAK